MTEDDTFQLLDGDQVTVPMMRQTTSLGYAEGEEYQVVELPYDGRELAMVILLPEASEFESFESSLNTGRIDTVLNDLEDRPITLTMPKFEFGSGFSLKDSLAAMGMRDAFSADADFSGMDGSRELFIRDVVHKAFVSVDEAGTEATASTAVVMERGQ